MLGSDVVVRALKESIALHEQSSAAVGPVVAAADVIVRALRAGGKVLAFGNGGSAADASHVAAELVGRFQRQRRGLAALALIADASVVTSVANDEGYERVFARQVEALGRHGDVAFAISTSGASPNVLAALDAARAQGLETIALTGRDGGPIGRAAAIHINVASNLTPRVQEVHRTLLHAMCELVENAFVER
ncbi:MAG: SIS domain-containing protein [Acidobacteriaceae bacterium]|nr:SIS domain-containing protein [Acidobacteriaceae bacterium]